jgi:hypothetical protein
MKAQDIYHKMRAIAEDYHAYTDQLTAIAKWIEAEFDYNPQKLANGANTSERQLTIPDAIKSVCDDCTAYPFDERGKTPLCSTCKNNPITRWK